VLDGLPPETGPIGQLMEEEEKEGHQRESYYLKLLVMPPKEAGPVIEAFRLPRW